MSSIRISGSGSVKAVNIGVFAFSNGTVPVTNIAWGVIPVGGYSTVDLYIKNTGNTPINTSFITENWTPAAASSFILLSWNATVTSYAVGEIQPIRFTLTVASNITGINDFEFTLVIIGEG